jgi:hypothetical protein
MDPHSFSKLDTDPHLLKKLDPVRICLTSMRIPVLRIRDVLSRIQIRPLLHPGSGSRIRGVKKYRIRICNTGGSKTPIVEKRFVSQNSLLAKTARSAFVCWESCHVLLRSCSENSVKFSRSFYFSNLQHTELEQNYINSLFLVTLFVF